MKVLMLVLLAGLFACEQETELDLPAHTPKLVVHGYVQTDSLFKIAVGRTFAANVLLPPADTYIATATVTLYENGTLKEVLTYDPVQNRYISAAAAVAGKIYRVTIAASGYETVEAITASPFPVSTQAVSYNRNARTDEHGIILSDVIFRFDDPASISNYYLAEINRALPGYPSSSFCVYSYDPAVEKYQSSLDPFESGSCIDNKEILFSDRSFNGVRKEITISGNHDSMAEFTDAATGAVYRPFLKRYSITAEFYKYTKAAISINGINDDPFSQPVSTYSNIKNGYGLFTVFSAVTDTLR